MATSAGSVRIGEPRRDDRSAHHGPAGAAHDRVVRPNRNAGTRGGNPARSELAADRRAGEPRRPVIRRIEASARAAIVGANERDRLRRLEQAVEASDTIYYEGEIGGLWRKHWATENSEKIGLSAASFVSGDTRIADLIPAQDLLAIMASFEKTLTDGLASVVTLYRVRQPNESYRWVRDRMTVLRNEAGEAVRYFGCATDVTELAEHCDPALLLHPKPRD